MGKRCAKLDERLKNTYNQQNSGEFQTASVTNEFATPDKNSADLSTGAEIQASTPARQSRNQRRFGIGELTAKGLARQSRNQNSEYLRKGAKAAKKLNFRTWRLGASKSRFLDSHGPPENLRKPRKFLIAGRSRGDWQGSD
jgi:hypothetical protein